MAEPEDKRFPPKGSRKRRVARQARPESRRCGARHGHTQRARQRHGPFPMGLATANELRQSGCPRAVRGDSRHSGPASGTIAFGLRWDQKPRRTVDPGADPARCRALGPSGGSERSAVWGETS